MPDLQLTGNQNSIQSQNRYKVPVNVLATENARICAETVRAELLQEEDANQRKFSQYRLIQITSIISDSLRPWTTLELWNWRK